MRHGSTFTGGGGFDLAAEWMGWENLFQIEINQYCQQHLKTRFPNTKLYGDIREFSGQEYRGAIDVLSGGPPCEDFSYAGKGSMDMELWIEWLRIIAETEVPILVAENVPGFAYRKGGLALDSVCLELENKGYEIIPLIIPASGKGAFTKRDRVWIVGFKKDTFYSDSNSLRPYRTQEHKQGSTQLQYEQISLPGSLVSEGVQQGTDPRVFRDTDGIPNRVDRIRMSGKAIVPQVAHEIFKAIEKLILSNETDN